MLKQTMKSKATLIQIISQLGLKVLTWPLLVKVESKKVKTEFNDNVRVSKKLFDF